MVELHIVAFLIGLMYRLSEVEYIWNKATNMYKYGRKISVRSRIWIPPWMKGTYKWKGKFWFWFHRLTFSFFEDGYHFFGNLPTVLILGYIGCMWYYNIEFFNLNWTSSLLLFSRWVGVKFGIYILIEERK